MRIAHEFMFHKSGMFITLTYEPDKVPMESAYIDDHLVHVPSLHKPDMQKFIKRLRHEYKEKMVYFAGGEYGQDRTTHPHYHAIVFPGLPDQKVRDVIINETWGQGMTHVGSVTPESIQYVAGYIQKKWYGNPQESPIYPSQEPFALMSKGIGSQFIDKYKESLLYSGKTSFQGVARKLPRYYRSKLTGGESIKTWTDAWELERKKVVAKKKQRLEREYTQEQIKQIGRYRLDTQLTENALEQHNDNMVEWLHMQNPKGGL